MAKGPGFFTRLKENWICLKKGRSGSRFLDCFYYKQELRHKYGSIYRRIDLGLGILVILFGLGMLPFPGPGWPFIAVGIALLAGESEKAARLMDRCEMFLRRQRTGIKRFWRRASLAMKSSITITAGALVSALGYGAYLVVQSFLG